MIWMYVCPGGLLLESGQVSHTLMVVHLPTATVLTNRPLCWVPACPMSAQAISCAKAKHGH